MNDPLAPTLGEAVPMVRALILGEEEAAVEGNAYLDPAQLAALREVLSLAEAAVATAEEVTPESRKA